MFLPVSGDYYCRYCAREGNDAWWNLLTLDRGQYRTTDTINVWGVVRDRQSGAVPKAVTVTLAASTGGSYTTQPAIARRTLDPNPAGAYVANLSFADLPPGEYQVTTRVGNAEIASRTLRVGPIAKPAWKLALDVPERAVVTGSSVTVNAEAAFFEGTPVAGSDLRFTAESEDDGEGNADTPRTSTTDAEGRATASVPVRLGGDTDEDGQWSVQSIVVRPSDPEEGDIYADAEVVVFRSTAVLDVDARPQGQDAHDHGLRARGRLRSLQRGSCGGPVGHRPAWRSARGPTGRHQDQREHPGHPPDRHPVRLHRQAHRPGVRVIDPDEGAAGARSSPPARMARSGWFSPSREAIAPTR